MARFIDDEAEGANFVVRRRNQKVTLLGSRIAPPAARRNDLGEAGTVIRIDRRDHDPVVGVEPGEGLGIAGAGLAGAQHPAVDRLPGIRPAVAQGFVGLPPLETREEIGPGRCNGSSGGVLFVPATCPSRSRVWTLAFRSGERWNPP